MAPNTPPKKPEVSSYQALRRCNVAQVAFFRTLSQHKKQLPCITRWPTGRGVAGWCVSVKTKVDLERTKQGVKVGRQTQLKQHLAARFCNVRRKGGGCCVKDACITFPPYPTSPIPAERGTRRIRILLPFVITPREFGTVLAPATSRADPRPQHDESSAVAVTATVV
jgi:hypothetical protein